MSDVTKFDLGDFRKVWDEETGEMYFAIVDVVEALTDSPRPAAYWRKMKMRELKEVVPFWNDFPLKHKKNGRTYKTDCANREGIFRIIQSIPSPKAEPFKLWFAQLGNERIEEIQDPTKAIERAREFYRAQGRDDEWITARLNSKNIRDELTDEWDARGIEGREYAFLTAEISRGTFGMNPSDHKKLKGLKKQSLRDHMSSAELVFTMLGELTTTQVARRDDAQGYDENKKAAREGGQFAGRSRQEYEELTGNNVVTSDNFLPEDKKKKELPPSDEDDGADVPF